MSGEIYIIRKALVVRTNTPYRFRRTERSEPHFQQMIDVCLAMGFTDPGRKKTYELQATRNTFETNPLTDRPAMPEETCSGPVGCIAHYSSLGVVTNSEAGRGAVQDEKDTLPL